MLTSFGIHFTDGDTFYRAAGNDNHHTLHSVQHAFELSIFRVHLLASNYAILLGFLGNTDFEIVLHLLTSFEERFGFAALHYSEKRGLFRGGYFEKNLKKVLCTLLLSV